MKKAIIYARYSSDSQTEQSIEGQLRVCREYAQNNEILIVDTYIDRAMTGTNDNRAAFQKMLKDSSRKQWQFVIVYKLDRFSRNKFESVIHKKTLRDNGVTILSAMENLTDSPEGRMMETVLEGFNQYFSEELTQKVNRGLKESWRKGKATGGQDIFGYDVVDKKYVVNEYESKIVEDAFLMYSQGYKAVAIADKFKECGCRRKNGKLVDHKYLYFILHNKRYTGVVEHQGELYDNIFPRIISDELWNKVNAINEENKLAPSRKKEIFDYILSGKLICGDCKHRMGGESGTSHTGAIHYYYICLSKRRKRAKCNMGRVQKQFIEDTVINATTQMLSSVNNIKKIAQSIYNVHKKETADNTALKLIEKKRAEAVKAQNNIVKAIEQGIITETTKSRLTELENLISQYDIEICKEKARSYTYLTADDIEMYLSKFVFDNTDDIKVRKLIVNAFVREVILYDDEIVITYNFTDSPEHLKLTKEHIVKTEKEIETADKTAISSNTGSYKLCHTAPKPIKTNRRKRFVFLFFVLNKGLAPMFAHCRQTLFATCITQLTASKERRKRVAFVEIVRSGHSKQDTQCPVQRTVVRQHRLFSVDDIGACCATIAITLVSLATSPVVRTRMDPVEPERFEGGLFSNIYNIRHAFQILFFPFNWKI